MGKHGQEAWAGRPWDFLVGGEESIFARLSYTGIQKERKEKKTELVDAQMVGTLWNNNKDNDWQLGAFPKRQVVLQALR